MDPSRFLRLVVYVSLFSACAGEATHQELPPRLALIGEGISAAEEAGAYRLDFGSVNTGASTTVEVVVANTGGGELTVRLEGNPSPPFYGAIPPLSLAAGERRAVEISYLPMSPTAHEQRLEINTNGAGGGGASLLLSGVGGDKAPALLELRGRDDDGSVSFPETIVGQSSTRSLTLENTTLTPFDVMLVMSGAFSTPHSRFKLGPEEETTFTITFTPKYPFDEYDERFEVWFWAEDDDALFVIESRLQGAGSEGPRPPLDCTKTEVAFEGVEIGARVTDRFTCTNGGDEDEGDGRIFVQATTASGDFYARVLHHDGTRGPRRSGYFPGESFIVEVSFQTFNPGETQVGTAVLHGEWSPLHEVDLTATSETLPPCELAIAPDRLDFGAVSSHAVLQTFVTNVGASRCGIVDAGVDETRNPGFQLMPHWRRFVLQSGETLALEVSIDRRSPDPMWSELQFTTTGREGRTHRIPLEADTLHDCLEVLPRSLELGSIPWGCTMRRYAWTIHNFCENEPSTIGAITVDEAYSFLGLTSLPAPPHTLAPGDYLDLGLSVAAPPHPTHDHDTFYAGVHIPTHGDQSSPTLMLPVAFKGIPPPPQTDTFILWSDESASSHTWPENQIASLRGHPADQNGDGVVDERDFEVAFDGVVTPPTSAALETNWSYDPAANAIVVAPALLGSQITVSVTYLVGCWEP